jgi:hypothetical protein
MNRGQNARRVVDGFKLPSSAPPSETELAWVEFLRIICNDQVPAPDSRMVVGLRMLLGVV